MLDDIQFYLFSFWRTTGNEAQFSFKIKEILSFKFAFKSRRLNQQKSFETFWFQSFFTFIDFFLLVNAIHAFLFLR